MCVVRHGAARLPGLQIAARLEEEPRSFWQVGFSLFPGVTVGGYVELWTPIDPRIPFAAEIARAESWLA